MSTPKQKSRAELILLHVILIGTIVGSLTVINFIFGGVCPLRMIFGIPCPFCGMTRAHLAFLKLNCAEAFSEHPLFLFGFPYLFLLFHPSIFRGKWSKIRKIMLVILTLLFIITYFLRLFSLWIDFK
ncbi:MAG: DUF2752 domain-containing protein [Ruminococcus sp.]|nr:DUF2752 domain-containing protein [Ruminococcus sp.]